MHVKDIEIKMDEHTKDNEDYLDGYYELTERDFYPPEDTRVYASSIDDIDDGDNFAEYAEYFWETYENHLFD